ncbi:DUF1508 domain-containing protein [Flavobacterium croceum]|uniref:DUF1508 domain-containing protein n=1 Tax=Flavobacterium croceum DSM 17960 TaxID=1121886 RepID=A0A2S4N746_9FLAO|nr:DUF1508 domain-containing protein [Flavobacterium croceum]POS01481.1 hypothetical protein Q361_11064 [Flavobacterium croceum DSM 17960]
MGTFVISKKQNGFYKYEFTSRKGKTIFTSKARELRFECEEEIELLRKECEKLVFTNFKSTNGKFFFKILLNENEIAISRKYTTLLLLQKAVTELQQTIAKSEILDFSTNHLADLFND